jgi:formate hydrogenlyase transcriptional activator
MSQDERPVYDRPGHPMFPASLIGDLSIRFINLPPDQIEHAIGEALRLACEWLDLDLAAVLQQGSADPRPRTMTHYYSPLAAAPARVVDPVNDYPWTLRAAMAGEVTLVNSLDQLPPDAARDGQSWHRTGIKSAIVFPLGAGGSILGAVGFATMRQERVWDPAVVRHLGTLARILANAIARKAMHVAVLDGEARLKLAVEAAGAGLWAMDLATRMVWVSQETQRLYGLPPHEYLDFDAVLATFHPDDRDRVRDAIGVAIEKCQDYRTEYRVVLPDGQTRWMAVRGRVQKDTYGRSMFMGVSLDVSVLKAAEAELQAAHDDVQRLREQLERENLYLREEVKGLVPATGILGKSAAIRRVLRQIEKVAPTPSTVLLMGETGTGKEILASAIHALSPRRDRAMVRVNCAAIPATLIESELFGREKGAYTGALSRQAGRFETANGSTIFLDEVGDLPTDVQVKLLRVLQERQIERLGSPRSIPIDVRIIAATNQNLEEAVRAGRFRQDLYYRLHVFPIVVPPLRDRPEDIPLLVSGLTEELAPLMGRKVQGVSRASLEALARYAWPGNIRELRNVIERALIVSAGPILHIDLPEGASETPQPEPRAGHSIAEVERSHILAVLDRTNWRIRGAGGAAEILDLKPTTLECRMKKLGINRATAKRASL